MRVTNSMINRNSMTNMNRNKVSVDAMNTQMTTQKKISRPSEDPVIAIRALRLRTNLSEINQYYTKNIPDAESWLELTETAIKNMKEIVSEVYKQCVKGSTDTLKAEDRSAILQNLQALRSQIYKEGNADNAGRTIFTGYKTGSQLTFATDELETRYNITESFSFEDIDEKRYYADLVDVPTNMGEVQNDVALEDMPKEAVHMRVRLSYAELETPPAGEELELKVTDAQGNASTITTKTMSYADWADSDFAVADDEVLFIPESGELIFGKDVSEQLKGDKANFTVNYNKTGFNDGEIRPEHYFDCVNITDEKNPITYKKEIQEIAYTICFDQTLVVNTQASDVFDASIGRDVDELTDAVQSAIAAHDKIAKLEAMKNQEQYADKESQELLDHWMEAAKKEASYMDDNMQKLYSKAVGDFQGYLDDIVAAQTDVGSKGDRLELTKTRVENQKTSFEKLKSTNEDRELSDIIIDYTSAYTAYQASLMASSKSNQQTLLNYI
ncbi:MAG: flagellar hook-associated protein 3 [Lachnospiraceae bacterium]|nr:flagellar hook-associated protein 3 [Lachnospiraceae bacterium]